MVVKYIMFKMENTNEFKGIIYKHTNTINGKSYIGQTIKTIEERWKGHVKCAENYNNYYFHRAIRKYGQECWKHTILETIITSTKKELQYKLNEREHYWIDYYDTFKDGYNSTNGGGQCVISEETKKKISDAKKGKPTWIKGKHHSEETINKISESHKGKTSWIKGKHQTEEVKKKISKTEKGKQHSEEAKKKMSESHKGSKLIMIYGSRHWVSSDEYEKYMLENA